MKDSLLEVDLLDIPVANIRLDWRKKMLLKGYCLEIFRSKCNSGASTLHCFAHLDEDVGEALPCLNAVLGGFGYIEEPPSLAIDNDSFPQDRRQCIAGQRAGGKDFSPGCRMRSMPLGKPRELSNRAEKEPRIIPIAQPLMAKKEKNWRITCRISLRLILWGGQSFAHALPGAGAGSRAARPA